MNFKNLLIRLLELFDFLDFNHLNYFHPFLIQKNQILRLFKKKKLTK